jgi:signal transduction histidine kinase
LVEGPDVESWKSSLTGLRMIRYARALSTMSGVFGLLGIIGIAVGIEELARVKPEYFPIAPDSSVMVVVLSVLLLGALQPRQTRLIKACLLLGTCFVVFVSAWLTFAFLFHPSFDLESHLFGYTRLEKGIQIGHMSPMASASYLLLGLGLLASMITKNRQWVAQFPVVMGGGAFFVGLVGTLGYGFGSPLLYGSTTRPIALLATLSLTLLGFSLICAMGPGSWPASALVGPSVKARLLRTFPPLTVLIVLLITWLFRQTENSSNPAIVASIIALVSAGIVVMVVSKLADAIGSAVDKSNAELFAVKQSLLALNAQLRTSSTELSAVNKELEAFSYSVSHDLRAPLTQIDGYAAILSSDHASKLDENGNLYIARLRASAKRMNGLIDDLLQLSRVVKSEMQVQEIDLSKIARSIIERLKTEDPTRNVTFTVAASAPAKGDTKLMEIALENLLNNSWKFTSKKAGARIEFGRMSTGGTTVYFVKDDGAGFEMKHTDRLFIAFQRLHSTSEFPGSGIGLATVRRIVTRHGGEVWAEGEVDKGATFYFTLGEARPEMAGNQRDTMSST